MAVGTALCPDQPMPQNLVLWCFESCVFGSVSCFEVSQGVVIVLEFLPVTKNAVLFEKGLAGAEL